MYRPLLLMLRNCGMFSARNGFQLCSYQTMIFLCYHAYLAKNAYIFVFQWIGKQSPWIILHYCNLAFACNWCYYGSLWYESKIRLLVHKCHDITPDCHKRRIHLLNCFVAIGILVEQVALILVTLAILTDEREFESFKNLFWIESTSFLNALIPNWMMTFFVLIDVIVCRPFVTTFLLLAILKAAVMFHNANLVYQELKKEIEGYFTKGYDSWMSTDISSSSYAVFSFQFGSTMFTIIVCIFKKTTFENALVVKLEYSVIILSMVSMFGLFVYLLFMHDDRHLYPITKVRYLSAIQHGDDEEFLLHAQALVEQMIDHPLLSVGGFFKFKREAAIRILGGLWTYFMAFFNLDQDAQELRRWLTTVEDHSE